VRSADGAGTDESGGVLAIDLALTETILIFYTTKVGPCENGNK